MPTPQVNSPEKSYLFKVSARDNMTNMHWTCRPQAAILWRYYAVRCLHARPNRPPHTSSQLTQQPQAITSSPSLPNYALCNEKPLRIEPEFVFLKHSDRVIDNNNKQDYSSSSSCSSYGTTTITRAMKTSSCAAVGLLAAGLAAPAVKASTVTKQVRRCFCLETLRL